jgi:hypothetical protein
MHEFQSTRDVSTNGDQPTQTMRKIFLTAQIMDTFRNTIYKECFAGAKRPEKRRQDYTQANNIATSICRIHFKDNLMMITAQDLRVEDVEYLKLA